MIMMIISDRKVSVSADTETEYSAEYSAETESSAIYIYSVSAEDSVSFDNRNRNQWRYLMKKKLTHRQYFNEDDSHLDKIFGSGNCVFFVELMLIARLPSPNII